MEITYDPVNRPGTANLLTILAACTDENPEEIAKRYAGKRHGDLKADVAEAVEQLLSGPRAEFERLQKEISYLTQIAKEGAHKAIAISEPTMRQVRSRLGLMDPLMAKF
jgi:tryptophanyl-tRNA synthetase